MSIRVEVLEAAWEEAQEQTKDMVFDYDLALIIFGRTVLRIIEEEKA